MKPYNAQSKCQKCGYEDIGTYYCEDSHGSSRDKILEQKAPHLDRTCRRCSWEWAEGLYQPTPAPEPPETGFYQVGEPRQPFPTVVETMFKDARSKLLSGPVTRIWTSDALDIVIAIQQRLAALWPKVGQALSVEAMERYLAGAGMVANGGLDTDNRTEFAKKLLSRMAQPSPVTAEKLAHFLAKLNAFEYDALEPEIQGLYDERAKRLLQAFPSLGSQPAGKLTREQILGALRKAKVGMPATEILKLADDLIALQLQTMVSREQWKKLWPKGYLTSHRPTENDIRVWLKSEFSMEVADRE